MRYVSYLRVSTDEQGKSGLGIEAQRAMIAAYLAGASVEAEYVEVMSGKADDRAILAKALAHARKAKATLVIAKLDRLSRRVSFIASLMESGVPFVCADNPGAKPFELHIRASIAEEERRMISQRTKDALKAAKARGIVLGGYRGGNGHAMASAKMSANTNAWRLSIQPVIMALKNKGLSLNQIASELNSQGITARLGGAWDAKQISRVVNSQ